MPLVTLGERALVATQQVLPGAIELVWKKGVFVYEGPEAIYTMSRNPSDKEPTRFLAFLILDKGAPVSVPAK